MKNSIKYTMTLLTMIVLCGCNRTIIDTTWKYNYAIIELPNGEVVEGTVESWKDFEDGDQLQITINGVTYLTDTTRAVLEYKQ